MKISKLTLDHGSWRAKHNGKYYWFPKKTRQQAMAAWLPIRTELARQELHEDEDRIRASLTANVAELGRMHDDYTTRHPKVNLPATATAGMSASVRLLPDACPHCGGAANPDPSLTASGSADSTAADYSTVGMAADAFLTDKRRQASARRIKPRRYANIRTGIKRFVRWIGAGKPLAAITGLRLKEYHGNLTDEDNAHHGGKGHYVQGNMQAATQFVRHLASLDLIALPAIIGSENLSAQIDDPMVKTWQPKRLVKVIEQLGAVYPVLRASMLLMANCGYRQTDVSDLHPSEIDWQTGVITRQRSKTRKRKGRNNPNVPMVRYKLWQVTLDALQACRSDNPLHVLTYPPTGGSLVKESFDPDTGKAGHTDHLGKTFKKAVAELGIDTDGLTLENIRKTSATLIYNCPDYGRYAEHFLGESPRSIASKHYTKPTANEFDACLAWLGKQYGFAR